MARIELSIEETYVPRWGLWEGIRELAQNGLDAQTEHGAKLTVSYASGTLTIRNEGCVLDRDALLLGRTSKAHRKDLVGQWGEGLKLGILALVRSGCPVSIRTGGELWTPRIERSKAFRANVLTFNIREGIPYEHAVEVRVSLASKDWETFHKRLLFLQPANPQDVKTSWGTLLGDEAHDGMIFVKGIWVCTDPDLTSGYNLIEAELDRDRKMVADWDLKWRLTYINMEAATKSPRAMDVVLSLLDDGGAKEVSYVDSMTTSNIPQEIAETAARRFREKYGPDAVPVASTAEASQVEHLSKRGVVCSPQMRAVLKAGKIETAENWHNSAAFLITSIYSPQELTQSELDTFLAICDLANRAGVPIDLNSISVVDFREDATLGLYERDKQISIARKVLGDREEALAVLLHELAHRTSEAGDGEHHQEWVEREMWVKVARHLWKK